MNVAASQELLTELANARQQLQTAFGSFLDQPSWVQLATLYDAMLRYQQLWVKAAR